MLRDIKNAIFWKSRFDKEWRNSTTFFEIIFGRTSDFMLEKKFLWRERKGPVNGYTPKLAVFHALEELANDYYYLNRDLDGIENDMLEVAHALRCAAPHLTESGEYCEQVSYLSERWQEYYEAYKIKNSKN